MRRGTNAKLMPNAKSQVVEACSCSRSFITEADIPTLAHRGQQPSWDRYLEAIYGPDVEYPVHLDTFEWFYRCDCHTVDRYCNISKSACRAVEHDYKSSCNLRSAPPFASNVLPAVWLANYKMRPCSVAFREAYVGVQIADLATHVRLAPSWRSWPNPEFRLAPYGFWLYPRRVPKCQPNQTWVEVIRRREPYERSGSVTWYYHAPGSGIWLNTGNTACIADVQRDSRWFPKSSTHFYVANSTSLRLNGFHFDSSLFAYQNLRHGFSPYDTLQRNGPYGNMLEIVDIRKGAAQSCGKSSGCTCTGELRAGWHANRKCECDDNLEIVNCGMPEQADRRDH